MDQKKSLIAALSVLVVVLAGALLYSVANNKTTSPASSTQNISKQSEQADVTATESNTEKTADVNTIENNIKYRTVKLFYYDYSKGECIGYSYQPEDITVQEKAVSKGLVPVERKIVDSDNVIEDTIGLFLEGKITDKEKTNGIYDGVYEGEYPLPGVKLIKFDLSADGILSLTFDDPGEKTKGVYCSVEIKRQQLEATAKQFPEVKSVKILPEREIFTENDF